MKANDNLLLRQTWSTINNPGWRNGALTVHSVPSLAPQLLPVAGEQGQTWPQKRRQGGGLWGAKPGLPLGGRTAASGDMGSQGHQCSHSPAPTLSLRAQALSLSLSLTPLFCSAVTVTQPMPISLSYRQWDFRECLCHDIFCWWSQGTGDGEWPEEAKGIREVMSTSASWSSQAGSAPADLEECPPISELSTHLWFCSLSQVCVGCSGMGICVLCLISLGWGRAQS